MSQTNNVFSQGSSQEIIKEVLKLNQSTLQEASLWGHKAVLLIESTIHSLVYLRDKNLYTLNIDNLKSFFNDLDKINKLSKNKNTPIELQNKVNNYLKILPSYRPELEEQEAKCKDFHGYISMILTFK